MIDIDLGIEYCGNDRELYKRIIKRFIENYKGFLKDLKRSNNKCDLIHTLKGITLNLGSKELFEISNKAMRDISYLEEFKKIFKKEYKKIKHLKI